MSVAGNGVQSRPVVENCARLIYGFVIYLVYKPMNTLNLKTHWQVRWNRPAILTLGWPYKGSGEGSFLWVGSQLSYIMKLYLKNTTHSPKTTRLDEPKELYSFEQGL